MGPEFEKGDGRLRPSLQQRLPGAEGPPEGNMDFDLVDVIEEECSPVSFRPQPGPRPLGSRLRAIAAAE